MTIFNMEGVSTATLPISVEYDDLIRHQEHYDRFAVDIEFLTFVRHQQAVVVRKWQEAEKECVRLQKEHENDQKELAKAETKIQTVRRNLETKIKIQAQLESEKSKLTFNIDSAKALIREYLSDSRTSQESRDRILNVLAVLDGGAADFVLKSRGNRNMSRSTDGSIDMLSEANSTDLEITQSEDDLDISVAGRRAMGNRRRQSNKRPSLEPKQGRFKKHTYGTPTSCSSTRQSVEVSSHDQITVKTVVKPSRSAGGPFSAVASIETTPKNVVLPPPDAYMSAKKYASELPPIQSETESDASSIQHLPTKPVQSKQTTPVYNPKQSTSSYNSPVVVARSRPHTWCQKTVIKPDICEPCGKRIKFSKIAFKCRDCKATCHPECKEQVPLPCVSAGTPSMSKNQMGTVTDYAPVTHPMVPGLIQHCINAIESRGETIIGLYRVSGGEKEVKDLKERFLRNKGVPNLTRYDIHAICGCVKDFLKSLQEPLVGRWFWRDFTVAADIQDTEKRMAELRKLVNDLPPANQDTLAFLMLHLQKIAEMPEVKMPVGNLAKIFGPTVVGYSSNDIDAPTMLRETKKQQQVMESFLTAPGAFWEDFINRDNENMYFDHKRSTASLASMTPSHSSVLKVRESNSKRIRYFDDSPKDLPPPKMANKNYFD